MHRAEEGPGQGESGAGRPGAGEEESCMSQRTLSLQFQASDGPEETLVGQFPPCALFTLWNPGSITQYT